jgi:diadenosine tetraphosphate (Ap4A) HIT family hydrolase
MLIYETENFILESHEKPEVDRLDGGHIKITPKVAVTDRTKLNSRLAIEFMRLSIVAGKAMALGMEKNGVEIGKINYQENGNWNPEMHLHLYGRSIKAVYQKFGDPIIPGHKDEYEPLNSDDIENIKVEMVRIFDDAEFKDKVWRL